MKQAAGQIIVTLDGDGQNDPADIPKLLAELSFCDMAAGVRARRQDSWLRLAMSRLANGIRSKLLGDGLRDTGCALKAFRQEVVGSFIPIRTLYSFMGAMAVAGGFTLRQVEVAHRPRTRGVSKVRFFRILVEAFARHVGHLVVLAAPLPWPNRVGCRFEKIGFRSELTPAAPLP